MYTESYLRLGLFLFIFSTFSYTATLKALPPLQTAEKLAQDSIDLETASLIYSEHKDAIGEEDFPAEQFRQAIWKIMVDTPCISENVYIKAAKFYRSSLGQTTDSITKSKHIDKLRLIAKHRIECFGGAEKVQSFFLADMARWEPKNPEILPLAETLILALGEDAQSRLVSIYFNFSASAFNASQLDTVAFYERIDFTLKTCEVNFAKQLNPEEEKRWSKIYDYAERIANSQKGYWTEARTLTWLERIDTALLNEPKALFRTLERLEKFDVPTLNAKAMELKVHCYQDEELSRLRTAQIQRRVQKLQDLGTSQIGLTILQDEIALMTQYADMSAAYNKIARGTYHFKIAEHYYLSKNPIAAKNAILRAIADRPDWGKAYILKGDILLSKADCSKDPREPHGGFHACAAIEAYSEAQTFSETSAVAASRIQDYQQHQPTQQQLFYHEASPGDRWKLDCWANTPFIICVKQR